MSRTATAENAADHEVTIVAVVPYGCHICALIGQFRPSVIGGPFYFPAHDIILMKTLPT